MKSIILKFFCFIFFISFVQVFANTLKDVPRNGTPKFYAISIGNNCYPALFLRACDFRKETYPFDWMLTDDFLGLQRAIEEEFLHFMNPEYLTYNKETQTVYNTLYGFSSSHFWDHQAIKYQMDETNFLNYCASVRASFQRRGQRFINALKSDVPVYLLRKKAPDYFLLIAFRDFLLSRYPQLNLTIVVFDEIDNPYPETSNIRYYKMDNIDFIPQPAIFSAFATDPRWSPILKDLEWLKNLQ